MNNCHVCERIAARDADQVPDWDNIFRTNYWDLAHSYNSSLLGWLVLVARRHISSTDELTADEARELGEFIPLISRVLKRELQCSKVYQMQFSEHPGHEHIHVHIVPRAADIPDDRKGRKIFEYLGADENSRIPEHTMNAFALKIRAWINEHGTFTNSLI